MQRSRHHRDKQATVFFYAVATIDQLGQDSSVSRWITGRCREGKNTRERIRRPYIYGCTPAG